MSVQSQIDRISDAVSDAFDALKAKGVTVPSGAKVDILAGMIADIKAGGNSNVETHEITFASDITGSGTATTLLSGNQFIKEHYAETNFFALMVAKTAVLQGAYRVLGVYHGNIQLGSGVASTHGFLTLLNAAGTGNVVAGINGAINGSTWNLGFRATSAGDLNLYTPASRNIAAGTYILYLGSGV